MHIEHFKYCRVPVTVLKPTSESEQQHPESGHSRLCKSALKFTPGEHVSTLSTGVKTEVRTLYGSKPLIPYL